MAIEDSEAAWSARELDLDRPDAEDVQAAVEVATDHDVPIMPEGTGSSLAGQGVGPGCVVVDVSRHIGSRRVDPPARTFATDFHSAGR